MSQNENIWININHLIVDRGSKTKLEVCEIKCTLFGASILSVIMSLKLL